MRTLTERTLLQRALSPVHLLRTVTLGVDTTAILVTDIPAGYERYRFVGSLRSSRPDNASDGVSAQFGAAGLQSGGGRYFYIVSNASFSTTLSAAATSMYVGRSNAASATPGQFSQLVIETGSELSPAWDNWEAAGTDRFWPMASKSGAGGHDDSRAAGVTGWRVFGTARLERVQLTPLVGPNFVTGSTLSVYGLI